ncbi:MAG TPA: ABC transporter ATP-binding protein [Rhodobacteraceae bacterium]|nr:sn-glycerol-3-phosphate ABC transporter ATP-binding protein UgpC [Paracoccaceae bacterium]HBH00074.1 ABC transporter ATP-binding protein [Paracoccaceae bacterium]
MATVTLTEINKYYGSLHALRDVTLGIGDGSFVVFVGPSGCGKSTLLRSIAGLEGIDSGTIEIGDRDVTGLEPAERDLSMVFQSYALYPHMTVRGNMEFGMKVNGVAAAERARRVAEAARILQLQDLLDRKPAQLSGGQRQRVAIGRSIVKNPAVFLFDEPLSNLDAKLRVQMRIELEALHKELGATMIYVTHDQVEAMTMADEIVVLNGGRVEQVGTPMQVYHSPATEFVAGFIGSPAMNILPVDSPLGSVVAPRPEAAKIGIRPEHIEIGTGNGPAVEATIRVRERLGAETYLYASTADGRQVVVKTDGDTPLEAGATLRLGLPGHRVHQFDAAGRTLGPAGG